MTANLPKVVVVAAVALTSLLAVSGCRAYVADADMDRVAIAGDVFAMTRSIKAAAWRECATRDPARATILLRKRRAPAGNKMWYFRCVPIDEYPDPDEARRVLREMR